jgi:cardiolipin synthase
VFTVPNIISVVRLLLVPVFLWLLHIDEVAAAGWLLAFIGATDWVDGYIARRFNQVSEVGKFLDPLADRLAVLAAVVGGLIYDVLPAWFAIALIVREVLIGIGALVIGLKVGTKLEVRWLGKLATLMLYAAIAWWYLGIGYEADWLIAAAYVVGVPGLIIYYVVGAQYLGDALSLMRDEPASDPDAAQ